MSGINSNFPLVRLASKYNEVQKDGRVLSNRASMEVLRERIRQLAERIDMNQAPDRLATLQKLWVEFLVLERAGDPKRFAVKQQINDEFEAAYHDYAAWKQMFEAIDLDRKLVESEVKILKEINATLTAEDAYNLTAQLLAVIISTVNNEPTLPENSKVLLLKRISYEFTKLIGDGVGSKVVLRAERSGTEIIDSGAGEVDREGVLHPGNQERPEVEGEDATTALSERYPE